MREFEPAEPLTTASAGESEDEIEILEVIGLEDDAPAPASSDRRKPRTARDRRAADLGERAEPPGPGRVSDQQRLERLRADFDNFQKRVERERRDHEQQATAQLVGRMLPVLDNLERALALDPNPDNDESLRDGVILIFRQILDELRKEGLEPVEALGQRFDPRYHEAVETQAADDGDTNLVVEELQRGYRFRGWLLRPARVKVTVDGQLAEAQRGSRRGR